MSVVLPRRTKMFSTGFQAVHGGHPAAQGLPVSALGLPAQTPPALPEAENGQHQHTGLVRLQEAASPDV